MSKESDIAKQWLNDLPAAAEKPGFKPEEMVVCEKCARKNPPTRSKCFYCGEQLQSENGQADTVVSNLRQMEAWEKGFNIILLNNAAKYTEESIHAAAKALRREAPEVADLLNSGRSLPVARAESKAEAEAIQGRLREAGLSSFIWADAEIDLESPVRLRGAGFDEEAVTFVLFNTGEEIRLPWSEIILVVTGSIFEKRVASTEKRKRNEAKQVTDSSETSRDEPVIDIYRRDDPTGWRVLTRGFDFSCLGAQKGLLAVENIKRLAGLIGRRAAGARIDDNYLSSRAVLGMVWANEEKMASHNWQRKGMGNIHFDNVTVIDNNAQFTKYSRLQWRLAKETNS